MAFTLRAHSIRKHCEVEDTGILTTVLQQNEQEAVLVKGQTHVALSTT